MRGLEKVWRWLARSKGIHLQVGERESRCGLGRSWSREQRGRGVEGGEKESSVALHLEDEIDELLLLCWRIP